MKTPIGILTTFNGYDPSYSLINVAETQIKMLLLGEYVPHVFVMEGFKPQEAFALPGVIMHYAPNVTTSNEGNLPQNWQEEVDKLSKFYGEAIDESKIKTFVTHDIISQPASLVHNLAARKASETRPDVFWLHQIHSVFSSNMASNILEAASLGRERWPNSKLMFPNAFDRPRVARNFHVEETDVLHCPHPTDLANFFNFHPVIDRLITEKRVWEKEVVMIYPARLDRGKQVEKVVEVAGAVKRMGSSVCFICCDFASTGGDKVVYRDQMKARAIELGLDETDVIFLSDFDDAFKYCAPRNVMAQLFSVANVFVGPSRSETYSLVTQEAGLCGNFLVLNGDFFPTRSIFGEDPKYFRFSANIGMDGLDGNTEVTYSNPQGYYDDIGRYIRHMVKNDRVLHMKTWLRQNRCIQAVAENYFFPLLAGGK